MILQVAEESIEPVILGLNQKIKVKKHISIRLGSDFSPNKQILPVSKQTTTEKVSKFGFLYPIFLRVECCQVYMGPWEDTMSYPLLINKSHKTHVFRCNICNLANTKLYWTCLLRSSNFLIMPVQTSCGSCLMILS